MNAEGKPIPLNSPVNYDPEAGMYAIRAKDEDDMKRLLDRYAQRAVAEAKAVTPGQPEVRSYQPSVTVNVTVIPQHWERMAAKVLLGLLAEQRPAEWRTSPQADELRSQLRAGDKAADQVRLGTPGAIQQLAAPPATAAFTQSVGDKTVAGVSLLGMFMLAFALPCDQHDAGLLWIADPLRPSWSVRGPWESALPQRLVHLSAEAH